MGGLQCDLRRGPAETDRLLCRETQQQQRRDGKQESTGEILLAVKKTGKKLFRKIKNK